MSSKFNYIFCPPLSRHCWQGSCIRLHGIVQQCCFSCLFFALLVQRIVHTVHILCLVFSSFFALCGGLKDKEASLWPESHWLNPPGSSGEIWVWRGSSNPSSTATTELPLSKALNPNHSSGATQPSYRCELDLGIPQTESIAVSETPLNE